MCGEDAESYKIEGRLREVRRKINDPVKNQDESGRIGTNEETDLVIKPAEIVRHIYIYIYIYIYIKHRE